MRILVTGGSGTFGQAFVRYLLPQKHERIVVFSRSEHKQARMKSDLAHLDTGSMRYFIGDIRDRDRLKRAMQGIDIVIHAAALKRIEVGWYDPIEVVKTNIGGSVNVIEASQDAGVEKVVMLSTDKAYQPISPYGQSKALAESLFLAANNIRGAYGPLYSICRYGNIWCSEGSVVPKWREILKTSDTVPVTDPDCTRFFMRIEEAIQLVLDTVATMQGGEVNIPTLPAYRLGDLAEAMGAKMDVTGLPAFEKRDEGMSDKHLSNLARRMTIDELRACLAQ